jgi:hypothetical protein
MRAVASAVLLASICATVPAVAADRAISLVTPPPVGENIAAMPQIANPVDDAERRINAALKRLDANVRKASKACAGDGWERSVEAPMAGPGFLSLTVTDSVFCEGDAHPDSGTFSIVYDLATGKPVDWAQLLPASLTGKQSLEEQGDGTKIVVLASARLFELYMAGYRAGEAPSDDLEECREALRITASESDGLPGMMVWLDAKQGGLAVLVGVAHVVKACEEEVVIPAATLRTEGARPALLKAFER